MPTIAEVRQQYPDYADMSDNALADALHSKFYSDMPKDAFYSKVGLGTTKAQSPSAISDIIKSAPGAVVKTVTGLAGMPGDIGSLLNRGIDYAAGKMGLPIPPANYDALTSGQIQRGAESITGKLPEPETIPGKVAANAIEFAPAMLGGPGGLISKAIARVAAPAAAVTAVGELTNDNPYAKLAAGLAAPFAATAAARAPAQILGNLGTHTGEQSINTAFRAGVKGGTAGEAFREQLRGGNPEEAVSDAKTALANLRQQKNIDYQTGMTAIKNDPAVLDFAPVDRAISDMQKVKTFKGQELSGSTQQVRSEINDTINKWKALDPKEYHTPGGFDALKQAIGDIKDSLPFNTPQRLVAERVYNSIRETITKQAPDYATVMKGYETAAKQINEIERTLSLGKKGTTDTALRKLQSVMRDNVNTNYGKRADLARSLANAGAPDLMEKLAGQANASWVPRGLGKIVAPIMLGSGYFNPLTAATLPFMSPRLVAEGVHGLGRVVGGVNAAKQAIGLPVSMNPERQTPGLMSLLTAGEQGLR